ncbi:MAG: sulfur oxidation c-type cytochrome SoxX [Hyphomicrobiaceae bacterium]
MAALVVSSAVRTAVQAEDGVVAYHVSGDAIPAPLTAMPGDVERGRAIVRDREIGNCLICHRIPEPTERFMGNLGPPLEAVGDRLTAGQIRLRLIDQSRLNPATLMPPYHRTTGLVRVAPAFRGRPVLDAQQIEDVVAYLSSLRSAEVSK